MSEYRAILVPKGGVADVEAALSRVADTLRQPLENAFLTACAQHICELVDNRFLGSGSPEDVATATLTAIENTRRLLAFEHIRNPGGVVRVYRTDVGDALVVFEDAPSWLDVDSLLPLFPAGSWAPARDADGIRVPSDSKSLRASLFSREDLGFEDLRGIWDRFPSLEERIRSLAQRAASEAKTTRVLEEKQDRTERSRLLQVFENNRWARQTPEGRAHVAAWEEKIRVECDLNIPFPYDDDGTPLSR